MTTLTGVNDHDGSEDAAVELLLNNWQDAEKPSDASEGETPSDTDDEDEDGDEDATLLDLTGDEESDEDTDDSEEAEADQTDDNDEDAEDGDEDEGEALEASDDHIVTLSVDGEQQTVSVKELKRLFGQEASLTRKSQEVAAARKAADADGERFVAATQKLLTKAEARFAPFQDIDWMVAQQRLDPEEFAALRKEAKDAYDDIEFLKAETDEVLTQIADARKQQMAETAKETIATLEKEIEGWGPELYDKVRANAVKAGMDPEVVSSIIDAPSIKLLHDAMRYSDLKAKAATKKVKKKAAPKRVVKPAPKTGGKMGVKTKAEEAHTRLAKTGSEEDAIAVLMAGWEDNGD